MRLPEGMQIQRIDLDGPLRDVYDAYHAATAHRPGPAFSFPHYSWLLRRGGSGDRVEAWAVMDGDRVAGACGLQFPLLDNTHLTEVFEGFTHPDFRRRGVARALFDHARRRTLAEGRRLVVGETETGGIGAAFIAAMGGEAVLSEARRTLDLRKADWATLEGMLPDVPGYYLEGFTGPAPEELLTDLATLIGGMNDAPRGADIEGLFVDAGRMREFEESVVPSGQESYVMIARRAADDAPAGYTRIYLDAARDDGWARQADTVVLAEHRGHRLGLLLKLANLLWVHESEPHLERVITWNATSNRHMLAINEAMGFELLDEWFTWQVAA
ncbi:GNAT family N-acetyltransferase [Nonomuraea typhae]|uniref:GNAT family N-acetyltransferase n=1 Tax=Nonomuraea typhae TaxID=2603600 RepID=UPI0012F8E843|nr:GNAT family N-acetyltransferase [Nonomuraea typhae]